MMNKLENILKEIVKEIEDKKEIFESEKDKWADKTGYDECTYNNFDIADCKVELLNEIQEIIKSYAPLNKDSHLEYDKEVNDFLKKMKSEKGYIYISELAERFKEVDDYYNHKPWNLLQILSNINIFVPCMGEEKWIPVNKELPKENGWYQCTCSDKEIWRNDIVRDLYYDSDIKEFIDNVRYQCNGLRNIDKYYWTKYVTAWQPLPEPYKGE